VESVRQLMRKIIPPRAESSAVTTTIALAAIIGVAAALMALLVHWLIGFLNVHLFFGIGAGDGPLPSGLDWRLALEPAAVFLAVAYLLRRWAPEAAGSGIGRVMDAVGRGAGHIRARLIALKTVATALSIGVGAPLGMEGPVVQTGAAVGSALGRHFKMGVGNLRVLVAAGAAAGLAAEYGAPIGGAVFSAELILGSAATAALLPLIVASFAAMLTRRAVLGDVAEYAIAAEQFHFGALDYAMFAVLGVVCGLAAVYFIKLIFATEDLMGRLLSDWRALALFGGLTVGLVGWLRPEALGTGHDVIQKLLREPEYSLRLLLLLALLKPLLCSVALGSKVSGGVFAPALFTGATLGAFFARSLSGQLGLPIASTSAYVVVGMAAVMGATMRAPLQAILVTFELCQNYSVILPLMIGCVISLKVSELFEPESAFSRRLAREGRRLHRGMDFALLKGLKVADIMDRNFVALSPEMLIEEAADQVETSENRTFPVADEDGILRGIVTLGGLVAAGLSQAEPATSGAVVRIGDLLEPEAVDLEPQQNLLSAWETMGNYDYDCLPVCRDAEGQRRIVAICEREAIVEMHDRQAFINLVRRDETGD